MSRYRDAAWAEASIAAQSVGTAYRQLPLWRRLLVRLVAPDLASEASRAARGLVITLPQQHAQPTQPAPSGGIFGSPRARR